MSLTRNAVRIVLWLPSEEQGRTVEHVVEHSRDDQYPSLCGGPAFELERQRDGSLRCVECQRRLYRPVARRGRLLEDPTR